ADWPRTADMTDGVLYPFGHGLSYASPAQTWTPLPEDAGVAAAGDARTFFAAGVPASSWSLHIADPSQSGSQTRLTTYPAEALGGGARPRVTGGLVQEGARRFQISGGAAAVALSNFESIDINREANGDVMLLMTLAMVDAPDQAAIAMAHDGASAQLLEVSIP